MANATAISENEAIWRGAVMNGRVLIALIFREAALRFGAGPFAYVWTLVEPTLLVGIMLVLRIYVKHYSPAFGESSTVFLLTGLLAFRITRNTINKAGKAITSNSALFGLGVVKPPDVVIARVVVEFTIWMIVLAIFFAAVSRILQLEVINNFQDFVIALCSIFYFCIAMSLFNATVGALVSIWRTIWKIATLPLLFASGVLYMPASMPPEILNVITWNPFLHCVEALRSTSYLDYMSLYDPVYLQSFSTIVLLLSLAIERLFRKEIIRAKGDDDDEEEV
ncbi:MAG: ABC transporter permease [Rhizobiaceae bacterium]|nr:ABC transporter permease [Rhizobiaceae bacterium]